MTFHRNSHHTDQELGVLGTISEMYPIGHIIQSIPSVRVKYLNVEFQFMLSACQVEFFIRHEKGVIVVNRIDISRLKIATNRNVAICRIITSIGIFQAVSIFRVKVCNNSPLCHL